MPHIVDFDAIEQKLFTLQHLCYGSKEFCEHYRIERESLNVTDYEWWEYQGILKTIASATLIEAAIKLRLVQDFIRAEDQDVSISELDEEAISGLNIGTVVTGSFPLTLRESCNKIVHATEAKLHWNPASSALGSFDYWSGIYKLWGSKEKDQWQVDLNIPAWCNAMIRLNKAVQVSFDWQHVAKWDE